MSRCTFLHEQKQGRTSHSLCWPDPGSLPRQECYNLKAGRGVCAGWLKAPGHRWVVPETSVEALKIPAAAAAEVTAGPDSGDLWPPSRTPSFP